MLSDSTHDTKSARDWATAVHLSALVGLLGNGIGFILGPLLVWLLKRHSHPFVNEQGLEAINFQITMVLCFIASVVLFSSLGAFWVGALLGITFALMAIIHPISAATKVSRGHHYRYPFSLRIFR